MESATDRRRVERRRACAGPTTLHHGSSSPSKIPYGGFSPVRLKIDIPPRPSRLACARRLYAVHSLIAPLPLVSLFRAITAQVRRGSTVGQTLSIQRPLARQRVVVSHRVNA